MKRLKPAIPPFLAASLAALSLVACGSDSKSGENLTTVQVSQRATVIVTDVTTSMLSNIQTISEMEAMDTLAGLFDELSVLLEEQVPVFAKTSQPLQNDDPWAFFDAAANDPEVGAQRLEQYLSECVFIDENLESSSTTSATFLLDGEAICDCDPADTMPPLPADDLAQCLQDMQTLQLRLRTELHGNEGIDVTVILGPERYEPVRLELQPGVLGAKVDLGELYDTLAFLDEIDQSEPSDGDITDELPINLVVSGVVKATLTLQSDEEMTFTVAITTPIDVFSTFPPEATLKVAAAPQLFSLHALGGDNPSVTMAVDLAAVDASLPWAFFAAEGTDTDGSLTGHLAGFEASLTTDARFDGEIQIKGIGIGGDPMLVKKDDTELVRVDLNKDSNGHFDLTIAGDFGSSDTPDHDSIVLAVSPEFALESHFALASIEADIDPSFAPDGVPPFLRAETIAFSITGENGGSVQPLPSTDGAVAVLDGTLTLSSQPDGGEVASVTVEADSCLLYAETTAADAHPLIDLFSSGACPQQ